MKKTIFMLMFVILSLLVIVGCENNVQPQQYPQGAYVGGGCVVSGPNIVEDNVVISINPSFEL